MDLPGMRSNRPGRGIGVPAVTLLMSQRRRCQGKAQVAREPQASRLVSAYRVTVVSNLVRGTDETLEKAALSMISLHLGLVMDSQSITAAWSHIPAIPSASMPVAG
jgi:hypothetical protein